MIQTLDQLHGLLKQFDRFTDDDIGKVYLSAFVTQHLKTGKPPTDADWARIRQWVSVAQANAAILTAIAAGAVEFEVINKGREANLRGAADAHRQLHAAMWEHMAQQPGRHDPPAAMRELAKVIQLRQPRDGGGT